MIIKDERDLKAPIEVAREVPPIEVETVMNDNNQFQHFLARYR